nr:MAG TPA: hypothetical protein [Caudoviricetes sp.]
MNVLIFVFIKFSLLCRTLFLAVSTVRSYSIYRVLAHPST